MVNCLALYFFKATNELWNYALTTHNESSLFAALNIWFVLGAARLWCLGLLDVWDEMA